MREIIAKRYKKTYIYMLIFSLVALVPVILAMTYDSMKFMSTVMALALGAAAVISVIILVDKGGVVEREGDTFVIKRGVAKSIVRISDVTNAYRTPCPKKPGELQDFSITIIVRDEGVQKEIVLYDVMHEDDAVNNILRCLK